MGPELSGPAPPIREPVTAADAYLHGVAEVLLDRQTAFQRLRVVRSPDFGKSLVLDDAWQVSQADEFLYHEALCHPAMLLHTAPHRVLVLGGGAGGLLREVLRWKTVEQAVLVDIDAEVLAACRALLPEIHQGAFEDPRAEVLAADAWDYLRQTPGGWDVILSDLTDPAEDGPSARLFSTAYMRLCREALNEGGTFAIQAGAACPPRLDLFARVMATVRTVFAYTSFCAVHVPTYGVSLGLALGAEQAVAFPSAADIDAALAERVRGELRMIDGRALQGLFNPPRYLRQAAADDVPPFTLADGADYTRDVLGG
jgi:spermidine synthase